MRYILKCLLLGYLGFFTYSIFATPVTQTTAPEGALSHWWVAIEGGYNFSTVNSNTLSEPMPFVFPPNDYYVSQARNDTGSVGAGLSYQFNLPGWEKLSNQWFSTDRLGLFYDYYFPANIDGKIYKWESSTIGYDYQYVVVSHVVWLDNQLDIISWKKLTPFVDASIGSAFNTASNYSENPVELPPRPSAAFANNTSTQFAWRAGFGLNYALDAYKYVSQISLEYRYSDLGNVNTGTSGTYPSVNHALSQRLTNSEIILALRCNL